MLPYWTCWNEMLSWIFRALLPACEANSSPVPVVPLVEPKTQSSNVRPGQEDAVLGSEVGADESSGISASASSATAAVFTTKYCSACLDLADTDDIHGVESIVCNKRGFQLMSYVCARPSSNVLPLHLTQLDDTTPKTASSNVPVYSSYWGSGLNCRIVMCTEAGSDRIA